MSSRNFLASLLPGLAASAAPAAVAAPLASAANPGEGLELSAEQQAQLTADVQSFGAEQHALGFAAATTRFAAVMASDKAKANPAGAICLLGNAKLAALSSDDIIEAIPAASPAPAAAAAPAAPTAAETARATAEERLEATPALALGNVGAKETTGQSGEAEAGSDEAVAGWRASMGRSPLAQGGGNGNPAAGWGNAQQNVRGQLAN